MNDESLNSNKAAANDLMMKWAHDLCCDRESVWAVIERLPGQSTSREQAILTLVAMNLESVLSQMNQFTTAIL